jgi:predicted RND superfamily exporter protein
MILDRRCWMVRFGEWILKYKAVGLLVILGLSVFFALHAGDLTMEEDETTWYPKGSTILATYNDFEARFGSEESVIVAYQWADPFSLDALRTLDALTRRLKRDVPYVDDAMSLTQFDDIVGAESALTVTPLIRLDDETVSIDSVRHRIAINPFLEGNLISSDESTVAIVLDIQRPESGIYEEQSTEIVTALNRVLDDEAARTGLSFYYGGSVITEREVERQLGSDISRLFPISMALTALLLLLFFRHIPSVVLPLLTVVLSLGWTLGLKSLVGSPISPVSTTLFALITVIGVADSVHLISQYWQEQGKHPTRKERLLATYRRAGKPCFLTSATTAVGFGSLAVSRIPAIRNLGCFAAFGIMSAFLLSMILVPIGMDWTSHRRARTPENRWLNRILERIASIDLKHPRLILAATVIVIVGMGVGILRIQTAGTMVDYFRSGSEIRSAIDFLGDRLNGVSSTEVVLYGDRDTFKQPEVLSGIADLQKLAESFPSVTASYSIVDTIRLINRALHGDDSAYYSIPATRPAVSQSILLYEMSGGEALRDFVSGDYATARVSIRTREMDDRSRKQLLTAVRDFAAREIPGVRAEITGMDLLVSEVNNQIVLTQIESFALAVAVIALLMILVFGWKGGLLSLLPNVLPIVFVLGLMGYGNFGLNIATAIIASIAIGIVVDDTIHYFSHFRDELHELGDRQEAMRSALLHVGRALCFTTLILVAGFAVFLTASLGIMVSYGILSGTAVLAALLGDLFVGPVLLSRVRVFEPKRSGPGREEG